MLRGLLGLADDDPQWYRIHGWLVGSLFADVPRPVLWATGPQGSGKSTRMRMVVSVVDPVTSLGGPPGKNTRDDIAKAKPRFLPSYDNVSAISQATSDFLCRLVTGVEEESRSLYTNDELHISEFKRAAVATSIVLPRGLGPDALSRLAVVEFPLLGDGDAHVELGELQARLVDAHPYILGALIEDVCGVLQCLPQARREAREDGIRLPRLADYAMILRALDHALFLDDHGESAHYDAFVARVNETLADRVEDDPLMLAVAHVVDRAGGTWTGTPSELLDAVNGSAPIRRAGDDGARPPHGTPNLLAGLADAGAGLALSRDPKAGWPVTARGLTDALAKAEAALRQVSIHCLRKSPTGTPLKSNGKKIVKLVRTAAR